MPAPHPWAKNPAPARGLDIRSAAIPQVAIAHEGSCASTSRNIFSPALYQKECSMATPRSNWACTLGSQDVGKLTLPSLSSCPRDGSVSENDHRSKEHGFAFHMSSFLTLTFITNSQRTSRFDCCRPTVFVRRMTRQSLGGPQVRWMDSRRRSGQTQPEQVGVVTANPRGLSSPHRRMTAVPNIAADASSKYQRTACK